MGGASALSRDYTFEKEPLMISEPLRCTWSRHSIANGFWDACLTRYRISVFQYTEAEEGDFYSKKPTRSGIYKINMR